MREKLYLTISKFSIRSLFYDYFMFFDTTPYRPISCSSGTRSEYGLTLNMQKKVLLILRYSATSEKRTFRSSLQLSKISKKA